MRRVCLSFLAGVVALGAGAPASAQSYRFVTPDGTVHFTNAPTDPRYHRLGLTPSPAPPVAPALAVAAPSRYDREIRAAASRYGLPEDLIAAVIRVESGFNPRAVSSKGARGLMQLMPDTASLLGVRDCFDPRQNIDGGSRHLRGLLERFPNVGVALAAYNAGEQAVLAYGGIPPYPETREYVSRILRALNRGIPASTYQRFERDGTVVYTNIPPRGRL